MRGLPATAAALATAALATAAAADPGEPVAVSFWGQALVTIETSWNLRVAIDPYALRVGYDDPGIEADLVLVTHEHFDHNNVALVRGAPHVERGLDGDGRVRAVDVVLDRRPNEASPSVSRAADALDRSSHAVRVRSIAAEHDDSGGSKRGRDAMFLIEADGVRILHCGDLGQRRLTREQLEAAGEIDVLLVPVGGTYTADGAAAATITEQLRPRLVVPIHYKTPACTIALDTERSFLDALPPRYERAAARGNTVAVTAGRGPSAGSPQVMVLTTRPCPVAPEVAALLDAVEQAARAAEAVFEGLSVAQMNHRPDNGTHTPRWNAEHVMGRELGFFSAIYASLDPAFPHMDLNPAQMPDDYVARHPDWTGAEEARQIERVQQLVRRFAYLLDGLPPDEKPPGNPWTLRGLFEQMQRHYTEHIANVKKKFLLPDWPAE